jgi:hypothetical protein
MIHLYEILAILFIHWFGDFVLQTDKQAKGKSENLKDLLSHTMDYSLVWFVAGVFYYIYGQYNPIFHIPYKTVTAFVLITFFCHTITDYFTSKLNSRLWKEGKVHNFFVSVGFDQWLHYAQLFITYYILTKYF